MKNKQIDQLCIDTIRSLCVEQIDQAKSGHPGMAIGAAAIMHTLYSRVLKINPLDDKWFNRDRFVLSAGHGSSLLYATLHLSGFLVGIEDLKKFRTLESITPGHPEVNLTPGVDASTGPLGQGVGIGVGMALAEEYLHANYPSLVDHYTYVLCGDGDLQEGITQESLSLAGHLNLKKLIVLYDSNDIQLDGEVSHAFSENNQQKYESLGLSYFYVEDGNDCDKINEAIKLAKQSSKPSLIEVKTIIGYGTKNQGTSKVHGSPLAHEEVVELREKLQGDPFSVDSSVYEYYRQCINKNNDEYFAWKTNYQNAPEEFQDLVNKSFKYDYDSIFSKFASDYNNPTRKASGKLLEEISNNNKFIMGGSADLASSVMTKISGDVFSKENRLGRNIYFGVREHAMGAICNGLALHHIVAFCSSFFAFSDYMKPAIRMSALMKLPVIYIYSHDSIAVGEDGATHHPIEQLTMLRSIPNVNVIRPADANETRKAYEQAFNSKNNPTVLVLTRQVVPLVTAENNDLDKGAYIISKEQQEDFDGILIASGSEVSLALEAKELLKKDGYDIRVVSMPSIYLFDKQPQEYKDKILPPHILKRMAIEMSEGSHYYKYVGLFGKTYTINEFGVSAKASVVIDYFGFTPEKIAQEYKKIDRIDLIRYLN